jgi:hypothetical protein
MSIYPNPVQDHLDLSVNTKAAISARITIRTSKGAVLYQVQRSLASGFNQVHINLSNYLAGTYLLTVESGSSVRSFKFLKR